MRNWKELLASNKEPIELAGKAIGLATVVLYVSGYIVERVHWNLFGYVMPVDHLELLYRGGNTVISLIASIALFGLSLLAPPLLDDKFSLDLLLPRLFAWVFLAMVVAGCLLLWRGKAEKGRWLVYAAAVVLGGFLVYQCRSAPSLLTPGVLLTGICQESLNREKRYFESWAGMAGLACVLWNFAVRTAIRASDSRARTAAASARVFFWAVIATLPFVYGAYRYPWEYPKVELSFSGGAPDAGPKRLEYIGHCALVSELKDDYVVFCRGSDSFVLRLRKDRVASITLRAPFDIRLK